MHLFIIPSWYPSNVQPFAGVFIREQAIAIASVALSNHVTVSTWGHKDGLLPIKELSRWKTVLSWRLAQRPNLIRTLGNANEVFNPLLTWSSRLPFRGLNRLVNVNQRNFEIATHHFGSVDLIHAHVSYPAGYIAAALKNRLGIPYVLTEHMGPFPQPTYLRDGRLMAEIITAFMEASASIAVSPFLADKIESFGIRRPHIIPNLVDEDRFIPSVPVSKRFVFLTLCSLTDKKGVDHLLHAFAKWDPPDEQVELMIGGDGPMGSAYKSLARQLGISDRVHWLGGVSREDAPALFQQCHVYVMPSQYETFGIVYAEAIACGKPVIATRCGGPEFIVNQFNGKLVEIGNIDELAATMSWMYKNWSSFDSTIIRTDFEEHFSRQAVVDKLYRLYEDVLS